MDIIEIIKVIVLGIVEGITEWLPISSTGHMILVDEFIKLNASPAFKEMFLVVIQLGAIIAVVLLYFQTLLPFSVQNKKIIIKRDVFTLWAKILVSCIPAAVIGVLFDDYFNEMFYNYQTVAVMLILFGIFFIAIENKHKNKSSNINSLNEITYKKAFVIGIFQLIAAIFPGTSRSGATILGGLMLGVSRTTAAEYTFLLAVPVMFGASALKLFKFGIEFTRAEAASLFIGMAAAFIVSLITIKFLLDYIKRNDFKVFGWYRIILGITVLIYFTIIF